MGLFAGSLEFGEKWPLHATNAPGNPEPTNSEVYDALLAMVFDLLRMKLCSKETRQILGQIRAVELRKLSKSVSPARL